MKIIPLKRPYIITYKDNSGIVDTDTEFDDQTMTRTPWLYWANLNAILRGPLDKSGRGMDAEEMQHSGELSRDLRKRKDKDTWPIEEEDYNFVVSKIKAFRWPTQADVYEEFLNDILHAKSVSKDRIAEAVQDIEDTDEDAEAVDDDAVAELPAANGTHAKPNRIVRLASPRSATTPKAVKARGRR